MQKFIDDVTKGTWEKEGWAKNWYCVFFFFALLCFKRILSIDFFFLVFRFNFHTYTISYGTSKVGVMIITKIWAKQYQDYMINSVHPGYGSFCCFQTCFFFLTSRCIVGTELNIRIKISKKIKKDNSPSFLSLILVQTNMTKNKSNVPLTPDEGDFFFVLDRCMGFV